MALRPSPFEDVADRDPLEAEAPGFLVDLRRCIGCHACSVACKTAHEVPLGEFPLRVRWLPRPHETAAGDRGSETRTYAFVPVFSESLCQDDPASTQVGLDPACVRACPTDALVFGDRADPTSAVSSRAARHATRELKAPGATDLKHAVSYIGLADWIDGKLNRGAALDPRDEDPIYEQRAGE